MLWYLKAALEAGWGAEEVGIGEEAYLHRISRLSIIKDTGFTHSWSPHSLLGSLQS